MVAVSLLIVTEDGPARLAPRGGPSRSVTRRRYQPTRRDQTVCRPGTEFGRRERMDRRLRDAGGQILGAVKATLIDDRVDIFAGPPDQGALGARLWVGRWKPTVRRHRGNFFCE